LYYQYVTKKLVNRGFSRVWKKTNRSLVVEQLKSKAARSAIEREQSPVLKSSEVDGAGVERGIIKLLRKAFEQCGLERVRGADLRRRVFL